MEIPTIITLCLFNNIEKIFREDLYSFQTDSILKYELKI